MRPPPTTATARKGGALILTVRVGGRAGELADACGPAVCGQVTAADKAAMAAFLTGFAKALQPHGLKVSQDVGQAAFPANTDTEKVRGSELRLFGMDTYTCNDTGPRAFQGFVSRAIEKLYEGCFFLCCGFGVGGCGLTPS